MGGMSAENNGQDDPKWPYKPGQVVPLTNERLYQELLEHMDKQTGGLEPIPVTRQSILEDALSFVSSSRNSRYGEPEDNFGIIAELWDDWLHKRFGIRLGLQTFDVAWLMILLKAARAANDPYYQDNYGDTAGYAAAGGEVAYKAQRKEAQGDD